MIECVKRPTCWFMGEWIDEGFDAFIVLLCVVLVKTALNSEKQSSAISKVVGLVGSWTTLLYEADIWMVKHTVYYWKLNTVCY